MKLFNRRQPEPRPIYVNEIKVELKPEDFLHFDKRRNYILKLNRPINPELARSLLLQCKEKGFKVEFVVLDGDVEFAQVESR